MTKDIMAVMYVAPVCYPAEKGAGAVVAVLMTFVKLAARLLPIKSRSILSRIVKKSISLSTQPWNLRGLYYPATYAETASLPQKVDGPVPLANMTYAVSAGHRPRLLRKIALFIVQKIMNSSS